jgi:hypothetical protein
MFEAIGAPFFEALAKAAESHLEAGHPCIAALRHAAHAGNPAATVEAQEALGALAPAVMTAIMADAHRTMREDGGVILGSWPAPDRSH